MKLADRLSQAIAAGIRRIGQISILPDPGGAAYTLRHIADEDADPASLEVHEGPAAARTLSTWAEDGHYRFNKGDLSLRRCWSVKTDRSR